MQHQLIDTPDFGMLQITFDQPGETIVAESGAMVAMDTQIEALGLDSIATMAGSRAKAGISANAA